MAPLKGSITALYVFDVAQEIDLEAVRRRLGGGAPSGAVGGKNAGPAGVYYAPPPVAVDGARLGHPMIDGFGLRAKFFDYGVLSLTLTRPFEGDWADLRDASHALVENEGLEREAHRACRAIVDSFGFAMRAPRQSFLSEDYLAFTVTSGAAPAADVIRDHGDDIAQILRGERAPLSTDERAAVLRHRLSYFDRDVIVVAWNAAFVYDAPDAVQAALDIFEVANAQLLEFRYYDDYLERELARIYPTLHRTTWFRGPEQAVRRLHAVFVDVNELTDRAENAFKVVGDVYAARLFSLATARVGLGTWKHSVAEKLRTLDEIGRFSAEMAGIRKANVLELVIVLILLFELGLFFAGIMQ